MTMQTLYKLTNADWTTRGNTKWGPGVQHCTSGEGRLCGPGWTHWYTDPLLAVLLNSIHGKFNLAEAVLWLGEGTIGADDHGLKVGCVDGRTLGIIPLPSVSTEQKARFAILCAKKVCFEPIWLAWADDWLSGHSKEAERAVATWVAAVATWVAAVATWVARAARAEVAAWVARAEVAAWVARSVALVAEEAAVVTRLDLIAIAKEAMTK